jgi:RNA polymerase sigma-70 factor (ECF subfamily)
MISSKEAEIQKLVEGCRKKDRSSQKLLYEKYFGIMMSISMRYCANWDESMEVVNSGFLKVFLKINDYQGKGSFEGWMKRIMVNTALDYLKSLKPRTDDIDDRVIFENDYYLENKALSDFSVDDILQKVQALPPMSRAVFNLNVIEGYKHRDISEQLGISEGTSHWHLQNAKKLLKEKLNRF